MKLLQLLFYIFDSEVYPNYFLVIFLNIHTGELIKLRITSKKKYRNKLRKFLRRNIVLAGYNNHKYDDKILQFLDYFDYDCTPHDIYCYSRYLVDGIIIPGFAAKLAGFEKVKFRRKNFISIDLMKFGDQASLKAMGLSLKHPLLQELPIPFDKYLTESEMETIDKYCENDIEITRKLYEAYLPKIEARELLNSQLEATKQKLGYKKDFRSLNDSTLASDIMALKYCYINNLNYYDFAKLRKQPYKSVSFSEIIAPDITFETPELQKFLTELKKQNLKFDDCQIETYNGSNFHTIKLDKTSFSEAKITLGKQTYKFGLGGLHSTSTNQVYKSDCDGQIVDIDVSSFYPQLIINKKLKPDWLNDSWLGIYQEIMDERLEAKRTGNKEKAEALKIVINSLYGNFNYPYFYAYDPKTGYSVTINGQLYLLMLIEQLEINGYEVISANTDGVTYLRKVSGAND